MDAPQQLTDAQLSWLRRRHVPETTINALNEAGHAYTDMPALHRAAEASGDYDDAITVARVIGPRSITAAALRQVMSSPDVAGARRVENAGVTAATLTILITYGELAGVSELLNAGMTVDIVERLYASGPPLLSARVMARLMHAGMTAEQLADLLDTHPDLYDRIVTSVLDIGLTPDDISELARTGLHLDDPMLVLPTKDEGTLSGLDPSVRISAAILTLAVGMLVSEAIDVARAIDAQPWRDLLIRLLLETDNPCYVSALVARGVESDANRVRLGRVSTPGRWLPIACLDRLEPRHHLSESDLSDDDRQALRQAGLTSADVLDLMRAGLPLTSAIELIYAWGTAAPESSLTSLAPASTLPWSAPVAHWWAAAAARGVSTSTIRTAVATIGYSGAAIALALGATGESITTWASLGTHPAVVMLLIEFGYSETDAIAAARHPSVTTVLAAASMGLPADKLTGLVAPDGSELTFAWPANRPISVDILTIMSEHGIALTEPAVVAGLDVLCDARVPLSVMRGALSRVAQRRQSEGQPEWAYHPIEWDLLVAIATADTPTLQRQRRPSTGQALTR